MHKHHNLLHLWHFNYHNFIHNKFNILLVADSLRYLGLSMASLFIPIFLLDIGYSLKSVILLELSMFALSIFLHIVIAALMHFWGVKKTLIASYFLNILLFALLYYSSQAINSIGSFPYLLVLGITNITGFTLYWSAHHIFFIKSTKAGSSGKKEGVLTAVLYLIGVAGPFLGGLLITFYGFKVVFLASAALMALASLILLFGKDIKITKCRLNKEKILDFKSARKNLIYFLQGMAFAATSYLWPVFLFLSAFAFTSIGLLYLISDLAFSIVCLISGKLSDKAGNRKLVSMGSLGLGSSLILRVAFVNPLGISVLQTIGGLFSALIHIPLNSGFFRLAHSDYYNKLLNREIYMYLGRIAALLIVIGFVTTMPDRSVSLGIGILACGFFVLVMSFLAKKDSPIIYSVKN